MPPPTPANPPRLFLHVGPPKTGTSAVQHVLRGHDDSVVVYPKIGLWRDGSHHNLVFNFYGDFSRPEVERMDMAAALAEIGTSVRRANRSLVISSEALIGRDLQPLLDALLAAIGARREEAETIVVHREPYGRAASLYNQAVKDPFARERRTPSEYLRQSAPHLTLAPRLAKIAAAGAPVKLMSYDPGRDFVARFLQRLGFPEAQIPAYEARNVSLSVKGLIATLAANRVARSAEHRTVIFAAIRRQRGFFAPSQFIFAAEAAQAVEPLFRSDRERLAADWGFKSALLDVPGLKNAFALSPEDALQIDAALESLTADDRNSMRAEVARLALAAGQA